jgi:hypothetical protein
MGMGMGGMGGMGMAPGMPGAMRSSLPGTAVKGVGNPAMQASKMGAGIADETAKQWCVAWERQQSCSRMLSCACMKACMLALAWSMIGAHCIARAVNTAVGPLPGRQRFEVPCPVLYVLPSHRRKLFVGQVPFEATETDLWAVFSTVGSILELVVLRTPQGKSKGCAFVTYETRCALLACHCSFLS